MSRIDDVIFQRQREIGVKEKELEILNKINELNKLIFSIQESVIDYEEWGFDINDLESFTKNYPFKLSLFDYEPHKNIWGNENEEEPEIQVQEFLNKLGFYHVNTGGGCTGYEKVISNISFLITDGNATAPDELKQKISLLVSDMDNNVLYSNFDSEKGSKMQELRVVDVTDKMISNLFEIYNKEIK